MIPRYTTPEMERLWSDENRYRLWLEVELAATRAMEAHGGVPKGTHAALAALRLRPRAARVEELERTTRHDVIAFLAHVEELAGDAARFLHFGMTSSDVLDTALALQLRDAAGLILAGTRRLLAALRARAMEHRETLVVGRTHGVHAQPTSLGLVFAGWYDEARRNAARIRRARREVAVGKLSGAVGTYLHLSPAVEAAAMRLLGLRPQAAATQVVPRDRHADYFAALAVAGTGLERMALTVRHWQRTEVAEAFEPFGRGQKGSSAMPHKRNPIACENVCGLARLLRAHAAASLENVALWHERDISHSGVERVIGPDATTLLHYMTRRMTGVVEGLEVDRARMARNLGLLGGLVHSETVMNLLIRAGLRRQEAYALVQKPALRALRDGTPFARLLLDDREVRGRLGAKAIREAFDERRALRHVDAVYERVFGHAK